MTNPLRVGEIMQAPGRLCVNPTSISGNSSDYPFGGNDLGVVRLLIAYPEQGILKITAEELGGQCVDGILGSENWKIGATLRNFDKIALAILFPNTATGGSGKLYIENKGINDTVRPGGLLSDRAVKLMFFPDAPLRDPTLIFYKALPMIDETAGFNFSANLEMTLGIAFQATAESYNNYDRVMMAGYYSDIVI